MRETVHMPKLGDTADEVLVTGWVAEIGDDLGEGQALMTVETSKVEADVPAPIAGTLVERLVDVDDEIEVGTPVAVLET